MRSQLAPGYALRKLAPQPTRTRTNNPEEWESTEHLGLDWQQQMDVLKDQDTGIALTSDLVEDVHDIHPPDKWDVGHRLALLALDKTYRVGNIVSAGPQFKSMEVVGNQAHLTFENADGGLLSLDGKQLTDFSIAGDDGNFVPAQGQ